MIDDPNKPRLSGQLLCRFRRRRARSRSCCRSTPISLGMPRFAFVAPRKPGLPSPSRSHGVAPCRHSRQTRRQRGSLRRWCCRSLVAVVHSLCVAGSPIPEVLTLGTVAYLAGCHSADSAYRLSAQGRSCCPASLSAGPVILSGKATRRRFPLAIRSIPQLGQTGASELEWST
jgi:hypothetical protein